MPEINTLWVVCLAAGGGYFLGLRKGAQNVRDLAQKRMADVLAGRNASPIKESDSRGSIKDISHDSPCPAPPTTGEDG